VAQLLRAPLDSWGDQALWQLAMCEFALEHIADVASSPKQLQLEFRAACEEVRHPDEVPRLRCLASSMTPSCCAMRCCISSRATSACTAPSSGALAASACWRCCRARHSSSCEAHARRRAQMAGKSPAEMLALVSNEKGKYCANWRENTCLTRHEDAGMALSLRGAVGVIKGGVRRLKHLPEGQSARPSSISRPSATTTIRHTLSSAQSR